MIHRWKDFDLEITGFIYRHDPTPSGETIPSETSTLKHVEIKKLQKNLHMTHHWKGLDLEVFDFTYHHDPTQSGETIPSQTSKL